MIKTIYTLYNAENDEIIMTGTIKEINIFLYNESADRCHTTGNWIDEEGRHFIDCGRNTYYYYE